MNCEQLRDKLDAYMDGELSDVELREMEAHAATCADCARELASARLVRETLSELPREVAVPLNAQAAWRRAVREEAGRNSHKNEEKPAKRRWLRAAYAIAAALVLVLGATALLGRTPGGQNPAPAGNLESVALDAGSGEAAPRAAIAMPTQAVVARDGEIEEETYEDDRAAYAVWKKYQTEDLIAACDTLDELVEEYNGLCGRDKFAASSPNGRASAVYRIELRRDYLEDFLSAAAHLGEEQDSETRDTQGDKVLIYIQIDQL